MTLIIIGCVGMIFIGITQIYQGGAGLVSLIREKREGKEEESEE